MFFLILLCFFIPVFANNSSQISYSNGFNWQSILFLLVFVAVFYFFMIRPQRKKNKEHQNLLASLKKGDEIVTTGGIFGKIKNLNDKIIELEVNNGIFIKIQRQSVINLFPKGTIFFN